MLCQDGIVRFIDIGTFAQLFDVGRLDDRVCNFLVGSSGRHIVAVMDSGNIHIYSAHTLAKQLNQVTMKSPISVCAEKIRKLHCGPKKLSPFLISLGQCDFRFDLFFSFRFSFPVIFSF